MTTIRHRSIDRKPTTGYFVEVDVCDSESNSNREIVERLAAELRTLGFHLSILELNDRPNSTGEWPFVRISTPSRKSELRKWLDAHGFADEPIIDARRP